MESRAWMRANHMELLDGWRDEFVRKGERTYTASDGREFEKSLTRTCLGCHDNQEEFCRKCHDYVGVDPVCWDCHGTGGRERR